MRRRARTAQRSAAAVSAQQFARAREAIEGRAFGLCEHCGDAWGSEAHHRMPRGMGGAARDALAHALSRLLWLCSGCHRRAENDRAWALEAGLLVRHGVTHTDRVPVLYRGSDVLLGDDGTIKPVTEEGLS